MARQNPAPEGFGSYGITSWQSQQEGSKVSSLALHLPTDGDYSESDGNYPGAAVE
jgi:hypothetical protein